MQAPNANGALPSGTLPNDAQPVGQGQGPQGLGGTAEATQADLDRQAIEAEVATSAQTLWSLIAEDARNGRVNPNDQKRGRADRRSGALSKLHSQKLGVSKPGAEPTVTPQLAQATGDAANILQSISTAQSQLGKLGQGAQGGGVKLPKEDTAGLGSGGLNLYI